MLFPLTTQRKA